MDSETLKEVIAKRHPDYDAKSAHWAFLQATYDGGRAWFNDHVFKYLKEGDAEFADRVTRAYRFNHTREVVDLVNKYLFRAEVNRKSKDASSGLRAFWKKSTSNGLSIDELMRVASTTSSILGRPWMVIDNSNTEIDDSTTVAEVSADTVYAYLVSPIDVLDMAYDEQGTLLWIMIRETVRDDKDPFDSTGDESNQWRIWTQNEWYLIEIDEENSTDEKVAYKISNGEHGLGVCPVVPIDNLISANLYSVPALINDIAYLDRACANYASNLDAIIQDQTFSQLAMPAQNVLPGDDAYDQILRMGTKRVFLYDGEGGTAPQFLSPDPRQAELILAAISQIINEIYHSVGLAGERTKQDNAKGIDNSSGVAKSKDFDRVVALLCSKADALELAENKIAEIVSLWNGETPPTDDLVTYSDTFDTQGIWEEFDIAMKLSVIEVPGLIQSEQMKRLVGKLFPYLSSDLKKEMEKEIEGMITVWQEKAEGVSQLDTASKLQEEAKRARERSGGTQSKSKGRATDQGN